MGTSHHARLQEFASAVAIAARADNLANSSRRGVCTRAITIMASHFISHLVWTGAVRTTESGATTFSRDLTVSCAGVTLPMSAAPAFNGDPGRANPEQLFVASLSACQALTFLFLAVRQAVPVAAYSDDAIGTLDVENARMRMTRIVLRPHIVVADEGAAAKARELVDKAHRACFIANSVSCLVEIHPTVDVAARAA